MTTIHKHYLDPVFHSPLNLSPIWDYCVAERAKKSLPQPEAAEKIFNLFQLSLSALQIVYEPAGKWIGRSILMISGLIKGELAGRGKKDSIWLDLAEISISALALLTNSERVIALQSLHILCQNIHNLWVKRDTEELFEIVSNALYLSTFWPRSRDAQYKYTLIFLGYRTLLSGYRMGRAGLAAYQNAKNRSYKIVEAGLHGVMMASQIYQFHSKYQVVQKIKKEIEEQAVVFMKVPEGQKLDSIPIEGLAGKSVHLIASTDSADQLKDAAAKITTDPRLNDLKENVEKPDRHNRRKDRQLYYEKKAAYKGFVKRRDHHYQEVVAAVKEHTATPEAGTIKVVALDSQKPMHSMIDGGLMYNTDKSGDYVLYTHKNGQWTLWEQGKI